MIITVKVSGKQEAEALIDKVTDWAKAGYQISFTNASRDIAQDVKQAIRGGQSNDGESLAPLRESTVKGPIRASSDTRIRGDFGETPLYATGRLAEDIVSEKIDDNNWEIGAYSDYGDKILSSNAAKNHSGEPFKGDTPKAVRDVLLVSEKHLDSVEEQVVNDLFILLGI